MAIETQKLGVKCGNTISFLLEHFLRFYIFRLDFFRLQCSAASSNHQPPPPPFLAIDPLRPTASSYCPDLAQIPLTLDHNGQLQMGGTAPADLLACSGNTAASATANLHLSLEQPAFNLLQEFQLGGHQPGNVGEQQAHCFDQQVANCVNFIQILLVQSLRGLPATNFLGFDFNSLAGINQQTAAVDPRVLVNLNSNPNYSMIFAVNWHFHLK